jgi:putative aldouronate transport system permease protein
MVKSKKSLFRKKISVFDIINTTILALFALIVVYPFYLCIILSFSNGTDITYNGVVYLWPRMFSLESYQYIFRDSSFLIAARNTVLRTLLGTVVSVLITAMFAYAISHREMKMRGLFVTMGLITLYFNGGLIPTFLLIKNIGLYNNFLVYILPTAFSMFNTMVFLAYFKGIPKGLEESAYIDGANELGIFFRIMMPVAKPVFACIILFVAVFQWNQYFDCMVYTSEENLEVMSYIFAKMLLAQRYLDTVAVALEDRTPEEIIAMQGPVTSLTTQMATMLVATVPIICVYPFLQKYFVKGIMVGSLKG